MKNSREIGCFFALTFRDGNRRRVFEGSARS
jgi:hypothetical protein